MVDIIVDILGLIGIIIISDGQDLPPLITYSIGVIVAGHIICSIIEWHGTKENKRNKMLDEPSYSNPSSKDSSADLTTSTTTAIISDSVSD